MCIRGTCCLEHLRLSFKVCFFFFLNWIPKAGLSLHIACLAWAADLQQASVFEFHPSHALDFKRTAGFTVLCTQAIISPPFLFVYLFLFNKSSEGTDSAVSGCCCCTASAKPTWRAQSWGGPLKPWSLGRAGSGAVPGTPPSSGAGGSSARVEAALKMLLRPFL